MLRLRIISPERVLFDGETESVKVPGTLGGMEILTGHAPLISALTPGRVQYATPEGVETVEIEGGFVEVQKNVVSLCVERR